MFGAALKDELKDATRICQTHHTCKTTNWTNESLPEPTLSQPKVSVSTTPAEIFPERSNAHTAASGRLQASHTPVQKSPKCRNLSVARLRQSPELEKNHPHLVRGKITCKGSQAASLMEVSASAHVDEDPGSFAVTSRLMYQSL